MNTLARSKRMLLVLALAMAMAVSFVCGALFIRAKAEALNTAELVSVPEGTAETKKYTMQGDSGDGSVTAGTEVGKAGLYIDVPEDNANGYKVDINGVFTGSVGFKVRFPGEGWWNEYNKEVVVTVTSVTDPSATFQIHLGGYYQQYGYVTYEWEGQTLYRTAESSNRADWGYPGYFEYEEYFYEQSVCMDFSRSHFLPILGNFGGGTSETPGYIGIEQDPDDSSVWYAVLYAGRGIEASGRRKKIAKFANDPETFEPLTAGQGTDPSLPKIDLSGGYTVSFSLKDPNAGKSFDMLIDSIAVSENGDPYNMVYSGGVISESPAEGYFMEAGTLDAAPSFYTLWAQTPQITLAAYDLDPSPADAEISLPAATYVSKASPEPQAVENISYRIGSGEWQQLTVADPAAPKLTTTVAGTYTVRYSAPFGDSELYVSQEITFEVRDDLVFEQTATADLVSVSGATAQAAARYIVGSDPYLAEAAPEEKGTPIGETGLLVTPDEFNADETYTVDFTGMFSGDTAIEWAVPGENWDNASEVVFTVAEVGNPDNSFRVIWTGANQSPAYVRYNYAGREGVPAQTLVRVSNGGATSYAMYSGVRPGDGDDITQFGRVGDNWFAQFKPFKGSWNNTEERAPGLLSLEWEGDVLNVVALNGSGTRTVMASFCDDPETFTPVTEKTKNELDYNLPKISFENGYTISVEVTANAMFMVYDVQTGGESVSFAEQELRWEPAFYTKGKQIPTLTLEDYESFDCVQAGTEIVLPAVTWTSAAQKQPQTVTDIGYSLNDGARTAVENGKFTPAEAGEYTVWYTVSVLGIDFTKQIQFTVCDYELTQVLQEATCVQEGYAEYTCKLCGTVRFETIPATGEHTLTKTEAKEATCTEAGNIEYYTCSVCDKLFSDAEGKEEIEQADTVVAAKGHALTKTEAKEATCTETGNIEYYTCSVCGKLFSDAEGKTEITQEQTAVAAKGHTLTKTEAKEATCTEAGNIEYYTCSVCGKLFSDAEGKEEIEQADTVVAAKGHTLTQTEAKEATCTEEGNIEYYTCSVCGKLFSDAEGKTEITQEQTAVAATGHSIKQVPAKAATCTEAGNGAYYKCEHCGKCWSDPEGQNEIAEASMTVPATGHDYEDGVCTVCGAEDPAYAAPGGCGGVVAGGFGFAAVGAIAVAAFALKKKSRR